MNPAIRPMLPLIAALWTSLALTGCASSGEQAVEENAVVHTSSPEDAAAIRSTSPIRGDSVVLYVNGLGCPLCASNIDKQLLRMDGVREAVVDLGTGTVKIGLAAGEKHPSPHDLRESVLDAGFTLIRIEQP